MLVSWFVNRGAVVFPAVIRAILMFVVVSAAPAILLAGSAGLLPSLNRMTAIPESATLVLSGLALLLVARVARRASDRTAA
jgi:hypothetical protein